MDISTLPLLFQHTAARRRLDDSPLMMSNKACFNTQPPEGGWQTQMGDAVRQCRFNTQPPEGGWDVTLLDARTIGVCRFNTQPPEGGWCLSQKPCSIRFRSPNFAKLLRKAQTRV